MIGFFSLWLPILLSAVFVFILSSVIHMVLKYHRNDFKKLPSEDEVMDALRRFNIPPGDYLMPCAGSPEVMRSQEFIEKSKKGPVGLMTILPSGVTSMTGPLVLWFLYCLVIGCFAAYVSACALPLVAEDGSVFHVVGATAFAGYALALLQHSIWYKRNWGTTLRSMFDGLLYALVTGWTFSWWW